MINMNLNLRTAAELAAGAEFLQRLSMCAPASVPTVRAEFVPTLTPAEAEKLEAELAQHHDEVGNQPPAPVEPHTIEAAPTPAKRRGRPPKARAIHSGPAEAVAQPEPVEPPLPPVEAAAQPEPVEPPPLEVTADDVRRAMGDYVKAFGMAAAQEDGPALLRSLFGADVAKISAIPADGFAKAYRAIVGMTEQNPHKRAKVA